MIGRTATTCRGGLGESHWATQAFQKSAGQARLPLRSSLMGASGHPIPKPAKKGLSTGNMERTAEAVASESWKGQAERHPKGPDRKGHG